MTEDVLLGRELITFQLVDWLRIGAESEQETLIAVLDAAQRLARDAFLPHNRQCDLEEPWQDADGVHVLPAVRHGMRLYAELGLFGMSFSDALGGLGLPFPLSLAIMGNFGAANISMAAYPMLTAANARVIASFGTAAQIETFARPEIEGRWFGTMCLSEPQAGSSLADIRTRATLDGEDELGSRYRLVGNKMWISGADQDVSENIVHLVLAKVARDDGSLPEGTKGISLFIVPKILPDGSHNDVAVAGLNHKMGYRGISNCLLNFGEEGGAVGWRVGEEGQGLACMFMMMNEARISIGIGAAALAYRGYRQSLRYARERAQGRSTGIRTGAPVPIIAHPDVRRMLLQQKAYAEGALALCLYCAALVDEQGSDADDLLALLTPVAKSWPSEFGLIANDLAIQVHGGYGYTRDFDVEQLWRDNRLNPIHEGTTGIQAIDLLGRKILSTDGRSLKLLRERIDATIANVTDQTALHPLARLLGDFWDHAALIIVDLGAIAGPAALDDATMFLRAFGHGVVAWLWLDQVGAAHQISNARLRDSLLAACRFFFENDLPQARTWLSIVGLHSPLVRELDDNLLA
ncbi:acyl-CoA dehydrogenase [Flavisphingomonas formosensis]|uniref:acyl-CoA dehydrogenase n=1 Tax=Flavisphingomonas formosensis TaxID=861534 RepID=UPI0012FB0150|nr:acyl-CoA dehydrogenase [Sphingomonas formosensis]